MNNTLLRQLTIAAISESHPEPEWLSLYANGSKIEMHSYSKTGVYCQIFAHYISIGAEGTAFEGEVTAIKVPLIPRICNFKTEQ